MPCLTKLVWLFCSSHSKPIGGRKVNPASTLSRNCLYIHLYAPYVNLRRSLARSRPVNSREKTDNLRISGGPPYIPDRLAAPPDSHKITDALYDPIPRCTGCPGSGFGSP